MSMHCVIMYIQTLGHIRGLIDQFDPIRKVKQYAKRLSRLDKTVSYIEHDIDV